MRIKYVNDKLAGNFQLYEKLKAREDLKLIHGWRSNKIWVCLGKN